MSDLEKLAMTIYWAAYDQYLGESFKHPKGFTMETAWKKISEPQRQFCRNQARRAMEFWRDGDSHG